MKLFSKIFGDPNEKYLKGLEKQVEIANALEKEFEQFSDTQIKEKTKEFKQRLSKGETLDDILPEAFALVREGAKRTLSQSHYNVQLLGGIVLHQGKITEMKTGEGKTLSSTLPIYLNTLEGKGVHVVTVNDYLAKRDAVWMGQIYDLLGLSVGCITHDSANLYNAEQGEEGSEADEERDLKGDFEVQTSYLKPCSRQEAYKADITYGTNHEFGFDYLRDNLVLDKTQKVQRGFNFAIIDEIDSILIDEARTPMIISQPDLESSKHYKEFSRIIPKLEKEVDYTMDEKLKAASLTEQGIDKIEKILGVGDIYNEKGIKYLHHLEQGLKAEAFFKRDKAYIVKDNKIIIIDEFTGRLMPGRRWSGGLHQAVEAKEGVEVQAESKTLATITFQNYFKFYDKLAGMTGTALTSAEEFDKVYQMGVIAIPTNRPLVRQDLPDLIYKSEKGKFQAIVQEIKERSDKGQPVLVGTRSVERNEYLSKLLDREGVKHQVLNAKNHSQEGAIIAQAGRQGAVTVATNMAGRGVDIALGGSPLVKEEAEKVKQLGGLCVIGTERHEARRIDNQLRGRAGRQGDSGTSQFFVSLEDELMRVFGGDRMKAIMDRLQLPEDQPISNRIISSAIEKAQTRVEGMNFDARKHVLEYDDVISKHRNRIYNQRQKVLDMSYDQLKQEILDIIKKEASIIVESANGKARDELKVILPIPEGVEIKTDKVMSLANQFITTREEKEGKESMLKLFRFAVLKTTDMFWTEHLYSLDHLKDSVRLQSYGGKDPLVEYKTQSHRIFQGLQSAINHQIARTVFKLSINT